MVGVWARGKKEKGKVSAGEMAKFIAGNFLSDKSRGWSPTEEWETNRPFEVSSHRGRAPQRGIIDVPRWT